VKKSLLDSIVSRIDREGLKLYLLTFGLEERENYETWMRELINNYGLDDEIRCSLLKIICDFIKEN
jgi:hypothetical protein